MSLTSKICRIVAFSTVIGVVLANSAFAEQRSSRTFEELAWQQGGPGLHFALLWGDWTEGDYGMIVKIEAGHAAPTHSHTADYHGVTLQGNWVHTYGANDNRVLGPGGYAFQSGGVNHGDRCEGPEDCLILIHQHGPRDFILSERPAGSD